MERTELKVKGEKQFRQLLGKAGKFAQDLGIHYAGDGNRGGAKHRGIFEEERIEKKRKKYTAEL